MKPRSRENIPIAGFVKLILPLSGLRIVSFESRRAKEMEALIQKQGAIALVAPSMQEIPLEENPEAFKFAEKLFAGEVDVLILLTGGGTRTLVEILKTRYSLEEITSQFRKIKLVIRGPKPRAALAEIGLKPDLAARQPNTWKEILGVLDRELPVRSKRIAVQEYGVSNHELVHELKDRGADVSSFPIYRWANPTDRGPMKEAIQQISNSQVDVVLWTNAQQIHHVIRIVREMDLEEKFRQGMNRVFIASIGPIMSETLREYGFLADFQPSQSKMGVMVSELALNIKEIKGKKKD